MQLFTLLLFHVILLCSIISTNGDVKEIECIGEECSELSSIGCNDETIINMIPQLESFIEYTLNVEEFSPKSIATHKYMPILQRALLWLAEQHQNELEIDPYADVEVSLSSERLIFIAIDNLKNINKIEQNFTSTPSIITIEECLVHLKKSRELKELPHRLNKATQFIQTIHKNVLQTRLDTLKKIKKAHERAAELERLTVLPNDKKRKKRKLRKKRTQKDISLEQRSSYEAEESTNHAILINQKDSLFTSDTANKLKNISDSILVESQRIKTLVVGSGPVGLLTSLEAFRRGADVQVTEKRNDWNRNIWFDLYGEPWSLALSHMREWGYIFQDLEFQDFKNATVSAITVRAQILERFLSKVGTIVGLPVQQGLEYIASCPSDPFRGRKRPWAVYHWVQDSSSLPPFLSHEDFVRKQREFRDNAEFWCLHTAEEIEIFFGEREEIESNNEGNGEERDIKGDGGRINNKSDSRSSNSGFVLVPFDVLVGSDGSSSRVREFADIGFEHQSLVELFPGSGVKINVTGGLKQTTLITNFKPYLNVRKNRGHKGRGNDKSTNTSKNVVGEGCPPLKDRGNGWKYSPAYSTFVSKGVTSVFKRFYHGHCHLQVLADNSVGAAWTRHYSLQKKLHTDWIEAFSLDIEEDDYDQLFPFYRHQYSPSQDSFTPDSVDPSSWQTDAIPWSKLREITNYYFVKQYATDESLKKDIERRVEDTEEFHIDLFDVKIYRAEKTIHSILPKEQRGGRVGLLMLQGDSSVTAHYRLGVGINRAFAAAQTFGATIEALSNLGANGFEYTEYNYGKISTIVEFTHKQNEEHLREIIQYQLRVMFLESYCDLVVMFEPSAPTIFESIMIYPKDHDIRDVGEEPLDPGAILDACSVGATIRE